MSGIGPQLHGIGKRGAEALAEKILDPNRNISEAFRNYTITLKDGKVTTGVYRREEGAVVIFGDLTGKEFSIPPLLVPHYLQPTSLHQKDTLAPYKS